MIWYSLFSPLTSCIHTEHFCALKCFSYEMQFALHLASEWKHRSITTTTTIQTTDPKQPNKKRKVMRSFQANNIERGRIAIRHQSGMASASAHNLAIQMSIKCFRNFLLSLCLFVGNYLLQVFSIYHSTLWGTFVCTGLNRLQGYVRFDDT